MDAIELTSKFFENNKEIIIDALVKTQIKTAIMTQNEDNIEKSRQFEIAIAAISNDLRHVSQEFGGTGKKRDIEHIQYNTAVEVKTSTPQQNVNLWKKPLAINWQKNKNNGVIDENYIQTKLPDGLLVYQKFSYDLGLPALLGYVSHPRLLDIFRTTLTATNADFYISVKMEDFDWKYEQSKIPVMSQDSYHKLSKLRDDLKRQIQEAENAWLATNQQGFADLDMHCKQFRVSRASLEEKEGIRNMRHKQGMSYPEIYRSTGYSPSYIKKICET